MKKNWSIAQLQDMQIKRPEWGPKKNLYATDIDRCLRGVYYALMGEEETTPASPEGIRRMEVGTMVEQVVVKKLKALGIFLSAQDRLYDEKHDVSGRHDGIVISPTHCTAEAKKIIKRRIAINRKISANTSDFYDKLFTFRDMIIEKKVDMRTKEFEILKEEFNDSVSETQKQNGILYDEDYALSRELLKPDPGNSLMVIEVKSINEWGFKYRQKEKSAMESHVKQAMFYLWKLRDTYPDILARIVYVQLPYMNLLEFDVEYDEKLVKEMQKTWKYVNTCIKKKEPPVLVPDVVQNMNGKWQVNKMAEWCGHHILCTGDPKWLAKAIVKVKQLNAKK